MIEDGVVEITEREIPRQASIYLYDVGRENKRDDDVDIPRVCVVQRNRGEPSVDRELMDKRRRVVFRGETQGGRKAF